MKVAKPTGALATSAFHSVKNLASAIALED